MKAGEANISATVTAYSRYLAHLYVSHFRRYCRRVGCRCGKQGSAGSGVVRWIYDKKRDHADVDIPHKCTGEIPPVSLLLWVRVWQILKVCTCVKRAVPTLPRILPSQTSTKILGKINLANTTPDSYEVCVVDPLGTIECDLRFEIVTDQAGSIEITSSPSGAKISLDSVYVGITPYTVDDVSPDIIWY